MRIRRLTIHRGCHVKALTPDDPRLLRADAVPNAGQQNAPIRISHDFRWQTIRLLIALTSWSVLLFGCSGAGLSADPATLTFSDWGLLFESASASLQLSQLYRTGPRVRAKLLVAKSITMADLFNGETIFRQRISEIVDVALERVSFEYLETTALQETARGSWAVTLAISALAPPPPEPNQSRIAAAVDAERARIVRCLVYGGTVRGTNVTVTSLQLFGTPIKLLSAALEGESFYQIDSTPWVRVNLALRADSSSTALSVAESSSSAAAFQNLRLRFVLSRFLPHLQVDTSSVLVRDALTPDVATQFGSEVAVIVVPIEIHVGDDPSVRRAVDGYLRNASLSSAIHEIEPQWTLLAVDVDIWGDLPSGSGVFWNTSNTTGSTEQATFEIELQVTGFTLTHIRKHAYAILDATKSGLSIALGAESVDVSFGTVELVRISQQVEEQEMAEFPASGGGDLGLSITPPANRDFVLRIVVAPITGNGISLALIRSSVEQIIDTTDIRLAFGFMDLSDLSSPSHLGSRITHLGTANATREQEVSSASSFVDVVLVLGGRDGLAAVVDILGLYAIRCALLEVLEPVLVTNDDLAVPSMIPLEDTYVRILFRVSIQDQAQRLGIEAGVRSQRFVRFVEGDPKADLRLVELHVDINADRSNSSRVSLRGAEFTAEVNSFTPAGDRKRVFESTEAVYQFANPISTQNPSVLTGAATTGCPLPTGRNTSWSLFRGCFVLRWSNHLPARSVYLQSLYVTHGATVTSSNIVLPTPGNSSVFLAPWVPDALNVAEPREWAVQLHSGIAPNVSVRLVFAFATSNGSCAVFQLAADFSLADTRLTSSTTELLSLRRLPVARLPPPFALVPPKKLLATLVTGSVSELQPTPSTVNVTIDLAPRSALGFFSPEAIFDAWQTRQPQCLDCLTAIDVCAQLEECVEITQCFRRVVDERITLLSDASNTTELSDLSRVLGSCLTSSSANTAQWSSRGRSAFTSVLRCVFRSSCAISPSPLAPLVLRYTPRSQTIHLVDTHFPFSLNFLLDINGGTGTSIDGRTVTQSYSNISSITPDTLGALRVVVLSLYGDMAHGMDIETSSTADATSGTTVVRIEYSFLDAGATGLPFISVAPHQDDPPPLVDSVSTDSLLLVS